MEESKNQKFRRLASSRTEKITDELRKISNLSSKTNYAYSEDDVETLFGFIQKRVDDARKEFDTDRTKPILKF